MIDLVLLGEPDGGGLAAAVASVLSRGGFPPARPGIHDAASLFSLREDIALSANAAGSILLCKNSFFGTVPESICLPNTVGVLRSDNLAAARALSQRRLPAVSCGMAATDTLTFSSMTGESAAICLQRSIPALDGSVVEPGELPLTLSRAYGDHALMCAVAALLLAGGWELLSRAVF